MPTEVIIEPPAEEVVVAESKVKAFATETLGVDMAARTVRHYITKPTVDADKDVLLPRGCDASRFTKSSTVFDVHQYGTKNVIGSCSKIEVGDDGIIATTKFASRPETLPDSVEWMPDTVLHLINEKHIKGWSVGFEPVSGRQPTTKDLSDFGSDCKYVQTRWKLLEYSVAPLPNNGDALTLSIKSMYSPELFEAVKSGRPLTELIKPKTMPVAPVATAPTPTPKVIPVRKIVIFSAPLKPAPKVVDIKVSQEQSIRIAANTALARIKGTLYPTH